MPARNFLQSKEWVEFQRSLGREVLEYSSSTSLEDSKLVLDKKDGIRAKIIRHDLPFKKNYLYIPHGPEMDFNQMTGGFKNPVANFVQWLREEGKKRKSIFIKAEPLTDNVAQAMAEVRFKKSKKEIQPSKTVIVDLQQSEDELLGRMHHKTRYNIGVADKHGIVVGEAGDVELFLKLLKKTTKRDRFHPHPKNYYEKLLKFFEGGKEIQVKLFLAYHPVSNSRELENRGRGDPRPIAGAIILLYRDSGYYLHGASDYDYRAMMAPHALHWHIIKQLKAEGLKQYDLWGIDPRKWPGVTRFKLGWGGRTIEYPGSFDLSISKFWYFIYRLARRLM